MYGLGELIIKASPLTLVALGLSIGFRANIWNIGAEGQLIMGAIAGETVALYFQDIESAWILPAMLVAGLLSGVAAAGLADVS